MSMSSERNIFTDDFQVKSRILKLNYLSVIEMLKLPSETIFHNNKD